MPFGIIYRTGPGMREVVEFGDRSTGRGTFWGEFRARHCNQRGLYGVRVRQCRDAALFPNYFGRLAVVINVNRRFVVFLWIGRALNAVVLIAVSTENVCRVGVDSSYADTSNCHGYTVCVAGEAFSFVCPGSLVFNPRLHYCDFDLHDSCPRRGKMSNSVYLLNRVATNLTLRP